MVRYITFESLTVLLGSRRVGFATLLAPFVSAANHISIGLPLNASSFTQRKWRPIISRMTKGHVKVLRQGDINDIEN